MKVSNPTGQGGRAAGRRARRVLCLPCTGAQLRACAARFPSWHGGVLRCRFGARREGHACVAQRSRSTLPPAPPCALCVCAVLSNPMRRQHYDLQWLELLDVEDYLSRFSDFILTANGLGMSLSAEAAGGAPRRAAGSTARGVGPAAKHLGGRGWQALCQASLKAA